MRRVLIVFLASLLAAPSAALSAPQNSSTSTATSLRTSQGLRAGAMREASRLAREPRVFQTASEKEPHSGGSWVRRHPALFGAVVGAGVGTVIAVSNTNELFCTGNDEDCLAYGSSGVAFGAALGAGIGLLAGYLVGKVASRGQQHAGESGSVRQP